MASFGGVGKEAITFVLSGDASGLISEFKDVEKAADKSLGATESKIEKLSATMTKVGAVSMATGLSTALGLVQFVKDAEDAEKATNKFETAVKGMGSSIKTADIKKLAFDLQQVAQVTDEQVVAAARWGAVYGLTNDQLEQLLRTAVDLAEQTGKSLDVVTKQLAKAASGEGYKGLTKLGLTFDETAYKADAFGTTIAESTEFAGGAAAKATDTMSGQLTRLGNNWDNVKEQIGAGANEVFEPLASGAADLMEKLATANPELLKTVGHFTALGSLGMTGFGGLATFAGQIVNIKDAASGLGIKLKDAEGGFTNLGKAAAVAGGAMAAFALADVTFAAINAAETTGNLGDALNDFVAKSKDAGNSSEDLAKDFGQLAREQAKTLEFSDLWTGFGARIVSSFDGAAVSIEDTQEALDLLSPAAALKAFEDALQAVTDTLEKGSDQRKTNQEFIDKNRKSLELESKAADATAEAVGGLTKAEQDDADALKKWDNALKFTNSSLGLFEIGAARGAAAAKGFNDAAEGLDHDELITSSLALGDAFKGVQESVEDLPGFFDKNQAALGGYNEEQQKAIEAVVGWGDAAKEHISTLIEQGRTTEEVTDRAGTYRDSLIAVMKQAGLSDDQIGEYLDTLGLTPEDVETELRLSGDAEAKWKLQLYSQDLVNLTEDQDTYVRALIDQGKYTEAWNAMNQFKAGVTVPVKFQIQQNVKGMIDWATGGARTVGVSTATAAQTGATVTPMVAPATTAPITINVTAGIGDPAEIGRKVIDAIRAAERVQGRGWRAA